MRQRAFAERPKMNRITKNTETHMKTLTAQEKVISEIHAIMTTMTAAAAHRAICACLCFVQTAAVNVWAEI